MRRALGLAVFLVLVLVFLAQAAHAGAGDYDLLLDKVKLRPGVKCDIHLKVFVNDEQPRCGKTVFAVPDWMHTAQSWDQYVEALFTHPYGGVGTSRVVAIDLPGHGQSSLPTRIPFGELLTDDYVTAIVAALDALQAHGICPQEIIGAGMGATEIMMLQERLVGNGSSLFGEYGIVRAVMFAPGPPAGIDWHIITDGTGQLMNDWFLQPEDPVLGRYHYIPAEMWGMVFFANPLYEVSPDAPSPAEIDARGYRAIGPLFVGMQMTGWTGFVYEGQPYIPRPEVSPGIFGLQSGTLLHVVAFEDDSWEYPSEVEQVFDHLICCPWWSRYTLVEAEGEVYDRVHGLYISNPSVIIEAMSEHGWFLW